MHNTKRFPVPDTPRPNLELETPPPLLAEPGRALVAAGALLLTQVKLRKDARLYIGDGVYGSFSELIDSEYELAARRIAPVDAEATDPTVEHDVVKEHVSNAVQGHTKPGSN